MKKNFRSKAEQEISRCRQGDWNHALRVVRWVKELGKGRKDLPLLISAAYIHDIGWRDILPTDTKITFDELLKFEKQANDNSKKFASDFLKSLGYSPDEVETVNRFIRAADEHASNTDDEAVIVDADNLSKLTIDHLKEKYQPSEWLRMHGVFSEMFPKLIQTEIGKSRFPSLLNDLKISIDKEFAVKEKLEIVKNRGEAAPNYARRNTNYQ
ncbi:HD domain-containing protein [Patescibacteria group bacterium AH-259-L05]|nr:HD domain-containing protein [Patescibacteria group bacterium AH-259-L05]